MFSPCLITVVTVEYEHCMRAVLLFATYNLHVHLFTTCIIHLYEFLTQMSDTIMTDDLFAFTGKHHVYTLLLCGPTFY